VIDPLVELVERLPPLQATVLVLAVSLGAALLVHTVAVRFAGHVVTRTETEFDNIVLGELRVPVVVTVALAGVYLLTQTDGVATALLVDPATLDTFFGKPALSVVLLVWAYALNSLVNRAVEAVKDRGGRFDFAPVFSNVWTLVVAVGTLGGLLALWGIEITPLLGAAGVAGIAVGFAAKDTVANFFGGIALYFDDTYKLGDYVVLDTGDAGTVVKVGVRSTTLLTRDEVLVTVPNSVLNASRIINESAPQRRKRTRVAVGVAYGTDLDRFEELVLDVAEAESLVLSSPKPRMRFRQFGDSALEYELLCWVASPTRARRAQHELNREIYRRLNEAGIEIPYPKRDVTVQPPTASTGPAGDAPEGVPDGRAAGGEAPVGDGGRDDAGAAAVPTDPDRDAGGHAETDAGGHAETDAGDGRPDGDRPDPGASPDGDGEDGGTSGVRGGDR
jgi:small-conductance mechanosensitive channel